MKRTNINRTLHHLAEQATVTRRAWALGRIIPIRVAMRLSWAIHRAIYVPFHDPRL